MGVRKGVIALVIVAVATIPLLPVFAHADDARTLLAEHKAFVGWQFGDGTFHYLRETGRIAKSTGVGTDRDATLTILRANTVYRITRTATATGLHEDNGYTGNVFWQTDQNGFIRQIIGDAQKAQIAEQLILTEATTAFDGTLEGNATVNGTPVTIVRISPAIALPIDLYVDPTTGAYKRVVIDPNGAFRSTIDILSYVDGPFGKKFIGSYKKSTSRYTTTITSVEAPSSLDPELFAPPHPTASWSFDPSTTPVPINYQPYNTHRIYLSVRINGVDGKFILDTGAGAGAGIFLTKGFADKLKLTPLGSATAVGIGGAVVTKTAKLDTIQIGGNTLRNVVCSYDPLSLDADGVLGFDLFAGAIVHLDLDAQTLTLYDPSDTDFSALAKGLPLTVDMDDGVPTVPMMIDGRIPVRAMLDTGNPTYVLFGPDLIDKDHLVTLSRSAVLKGVGGYEAVDCGAFKSISLGPITYQRAPACQSKALEGHTILVGVDFLRHFNYWFDYPDSAVVLVPRRPNAP